MPLLRRLSLLLGLEGVALVVLGIGYGVASLDDSGPGTDPLPAQLAAGTAIVTGAVLVLLARAAGEARSWSRAPAITLNIFPFPVALGIFQAGVWWVATPMIVLAGSVLYLFATPELRVLFRERA